MAKLKNYKGTAVTPAGFTQKGTGDYALMEAGAIQVDEEGKRLDAELVDIKAEMLTSGALDDYYTKSEVTALIPDVSDFISEIPSEYITETELEQKGYLTEHQSLENYATNASVREAIESVEEKIPSLDGYATETFVTSEIAKAQLGEDEVDLTNYYTKDETYNKSEIDTELSDIKAQSQYDFVITSPEDFTNENLSSMYGKILLKWGNSRMEEYSPDYVEDIELNDDITLIDFNNVPVVISEIRATGETTIKNIDEYLTTASSGPHIYNFALVENCTGSYPDTTLYNCKQVLNSTFARAVNCQNISNVIIDIDDMFITDVDNSNIVFENCDNINNVILSTSDESYDFTAGITRPIIDFKNCKHISNVHSVNTSLINYEDCLYVDGNTCDGYYTPSTVISKDAIAEQGSFAGLKGFIFNDGTGTNTPASVFNADGTFILYATNSDENPVKDFYDFYYRGDSSDPNYPYGIVLDSKGDYVFGKTTFDGESPIAEQPYYISFINGSKYMNYATVTMSYADPILTITCKDINGDAKNNGTWNATIKENRPADGSALDECTFFFLDLPEIGSIDLGINSRAFGDSSKALGRGAFAAGRDAVAQSQYSMALGRECVANYAAVAINRKAQALGDNSFAGGSGSKALHNVSYAWGHTLQTGAQYQYVIGKYNEAISNGAFILGNGSSSKRSNALVVDYNGNATFAGKITAADPTVSTHLTTKNYVDTSVTTNINTLSSSLNSKLTGYVPRTTAYNDNSNAIASSFIIGNSTCNAGRSYILGNDNTIKITNADNQNIYTDQAIIVGGNNTVQTQYSVALGYGLKTLEPVSKNQQNRCQTLLGRFNDPVRGLSTGSSRSASDALVVIGNGVGENKYADDGITITTKNRSNAAIIWADGHMTIGADPINRMDVVPKHMYDELMARVEVLEAQLEGVTETLTQLNDGGIE